jgi:Putative adhesin
VNSRSVAIASVIALTASGCGVGVHFADYRHSTTPADAHVTGTVNRLEVEAGDGHVVVRAGSGDGVTIHRVVQYQSGTPHPTQRLADGTLTFVRGCSRCRVDYDLTVPASVSVRARTDSGRIDVVGVAAADLGSDSGSQTVRHVSGSVTAHSDSGGLTVQDVAGALETSSDSGSLRATELRAPTVRASSDSGGLRMVFTSPPQSVRATTDSGSVRIGLHGGQYKVDLGSDSGGKHVTVPTAPDAPSRIYVRTDSGGINLVPA